MVCFALRCLLHVRSLSEPWTQLARPPGKLSMFHVGDDTSRWIGASRNPPLRSGGLPCSLSAVCGRACTPVYQTSPVYETSRVRTGHGVVCTKYGHQFTKYSGWRFTNACGQHHSWRRYKELATDVPGFNKPSHGYLQKWVGPSTFALQHDLRCALFLPFHLFVSSYRSRS